MRHTHFTRYTLVAAALCAFSSAAAAQNIPAWANIGRVAAPHHTGADLLARLRNAPDGKTLASRLGAMPAVTQAGSNGWPATFDVSFDYSNGLWGTAAAGVKQMKIYASMSYGQVYQSRYGLVIRMDASASATPTATFEFDSLPKGNYVVAVNLHSANSSTGASISELTPARVPDIDCPPSLLTQSDAQGNSACVVTLVMPQDGPATITLNMKRGGANVIGASVSRISP